MSTVLIEVNTKDDVEQLRQVRNQCRLFMTRNTDEITKEQQQLWYSKLDKEFNKVYLLHEIYCGVAFSVIGYGLFRLENGCVVLSGGLIPEERGKGYGTTLFEYLVENAKLLDRPIKLEVLKNNIKAFSIYNKIGFRVIADDGKIITMRYHYDSVI